MKCALDPPPIGALLERELVLVQLLEPSSNQFYGSCHDSEWTMREEDNYPVHRHIEIRQAYGPVIGDNTHVTQNFTSPPPPTTEELLIAIQRANARLRNIATDIDGIHIERAEVAQIVDWIHRADAKEKLGVVLDQPGGGKTVVMHDVLARLEGEGVPVLAIKADSLSGIKTHSALADRLGLPVSVEDLVCQLATEGLFVVLVDQLDALSLSLSRDQAALDIMLSMLARLRDQDNVRILASCRTFDLNNDPRLSQVKVNRKFQLQPLTNEQIDSVLQAIGVAPGLLLPAHRELLATPLHLAVYARVIRASNAEQSLESFQNLQELYEALWQTQIAIARPESPPVTERIAAIYQLVEVMNDRQQIVAPVAVLDNHPEAAAYLEREGFLHRESRNWFFFHQTLFDYCYARRFVSQGESLSQTIMNGSQGLFERSKMVQVLAYLRGADESTYQRELTTLLFSKELRFHLRLLLIGWLGSLPNPTVVERHIAQRLNGKKEDRALFLQAISGNSAWFDFLSREYIPQWLRSTDEQLVNQVSYYLGTMLSQRAEVALSLLEPFIGRSDLWDWRIARCLNHLEDWHNERAVDLLCNLVRRNQTLRHTALSLRRLAESNPAAGCRVLRVYLEQRMHELLHRKVADGERRQLVGTNRTAGVSDETHWEHFFLGEPVIAKIVEQALLRCPEKIIEELLPWFQGTAEAMSRSFFDDAYPLDLVFDTGWYGDHLREGPTFARQMAEGLRKFAQINPSAFREIARELAHVESLAVQRVLIHAYLGDPGEYAIEIYDYFMGDTRRLKVGEPTESPYHDLRRLFTATLSHLDKERRAALEGLILNLRPKWEQRQRASSGITQLSFLKNAPLHLLTSRAQQRRRELEYKFPGFRPNDPQGIRGGTVGPPIEHVAQEKMSDEAWLGAMRKYDNENISGGRDRDFLKGGVLELSRAFQERVKQHPERFYKLAQRFEETISPEYLSAAITGLAESSAPSEWVFDLVRRFANRLYGEFRRYVCWALSKRAKAGVPDDLLELMANWALHDPDPEDEIWNQEAADGQLYYSGDAYLHGINTNRGSAIRAVCHCALERTPPQCERAFQLLEQAAEDPSIAVRTCIIEALQPLLAQDTSRSLTIFEQAMKGQPALLQSRPVHNFLHQTYHQHFDRIRPHIQALLVHPDNMARQVGAQLACVAAFDYSTAADLAEQAMVGDAALRRGAAQVYAYNLGHEVFQQVCREQLLRLLSDPDAEVRQEVGKCFYHLRPEQLDDFRSFIEAFLASPSLLAGARSLIEYLKPLATDEYQLALQVTTRLLEVVGNEVVDIRTSTALLEHDLVRLPLTVYTQAADTETKAQAMTVFEQLLALGSHSAHQALNDWDRR